MVTSVFPTGPLFDTEASAMVADGLLVACAGGYLVAAGILSRRGRRWPTPWTAAFVAGLLALFLAVGSGIGAYDDVDFPAHVAQHLLLMMVAAPLLVAGRAPMLAAQVAPRRLQRRLVRVLNGRFLHRPTGPLVWSLYFASMWGCFLPTYYRLEVGHGPLHDATHGWLVGVGVLFWQGVLGPGWSWRQVGLVRRWLPVVAGMPVEAALGFWLSSTSRPLAGASLAATHTGGQLLWTASMTLSGVALSVALWQWAAAEERARRRADRLAEERGPVVVDGPPQERPHLSWPGGRRRRSAGLAPGS